MKQTLIVYRKSDRKLIASFQPNALIVEMDALVIPGIAYVVTTEKEPFVRMPNGDYYVKDL